MNRNVKDKEYKAFLENMFYMYTKLAEYLRLIFETNVEMSNEILTKENLIQLINLLAYFPEQNLSQSEYFWLTKINLSHLIIFILMQQNSEIHQLIHNSIAENASKLFSKKRKSSLLFSFLLIKLVDFFRHSIVTITNDY